MIYIRGQREDFDHWAALGNTRWGYDHLLPYFIKSEGNQRGANPLHGGDGPLKVSDIGTQHELIEAFIDGAQQIGVPRTDDFNGARQEGAGYFQLNTWKGWRCSTAKAYLAPARRRGNLQVETEAMAAGIEFDGARASGVRYRQGGAMKSATARAEVLLAAGAIQSPQLLQLSGIGAEALLREHGITPRKVLSGVGENLQDHLQMRLIFECTKPITTNDQLNSWLGQLKLGLQWLLFRSGPLAVGITRRLLHARCTTTRAGRWRPRLTSSSTWPRCRPTWPAARCTRSRASRCRCASCGPNRAATSASVASTPSSRRRCSPITCPPIWTAAPQWPR